MNSNNPYQAPRVRDSASRPRRRRHGDAPWQVGPLLSIGILCFVACLPALGLAAVGAFGIVTTVIPILLALFGGFALKRSYDLFRRR